jgi:two-component system cell cycle sensor histidine kinase/response regulator CckA
MILLVEDDDLLRRAFARLLRQKGYRVLEARDGEEALKFLDDWVLKLIITDLVLPKLNGIDLIEIVRIKWHRIPAIIISGYLSQDAGSLILERDGVFIQKPIKTDHLLEAVERLVGRPN